MTRIAYCILTYKEPERVANLVNRLQTDGDMFYVHFDLKIGKQKFSKWKSLVKSYCQGQNVEIVSKRRCKWASFGTVDVLLDAMRYFKTLDYDYFINLSGECYPIKPIHKIRETLGDSSYGFMEFFRLPYDYWGGNGGLNRLHNRYYFISVGRSTYPRTFGVPRLNRKVPGNLEPYGGSVWFCLPKKLANYVVDFVDLNPAVRDFFKRSLAPDEMFFQTILLNSPYKSLLINDNKRYIDWSEGKSGHPKILTKNDLKAIMNSDKFFARKFNLSIDKNILQRIDEELVGPSP